MKHSAQLEGNATVNTKKRTKMETQRQIDNRLLGMIQRHFPSLPLDDKYTDWQRWLKFANAVRSDALEQAARELEHHCSHWEAWFLKQRAAGEIPTFDEAVTPSNAGGNQPHR